MIYQELKMKDYLARLLVTLDTSSLAEMTLEKTLKVARHSLLHVDVNPT